ncbi:hypothetical protein EDB80DRAFT_758072 [Ilyonectria destructans]|nr:hypothetical protein EDB80DRAFT_758072 [Ilyonectria destructans]
MAAGINERPNQILMLVAEDVVPIMAEERPLCEEWLRSIGFLAPGEDEERFLKATKTRITGSGAARRVVQSADAKQREAIKQTFWDRIDGLEALSERVLGRRRRFQSMWTGLACFLVWCIKEDDESLEEMGLELDEEDMEDVLDVMVAATPGRGWVMDNDDPGDALQGLFAKALTDRSAKVQSNLLLWWTAILIRSAISEEGKEDYISRGKFSMNILPMDVDIRDRIEAIVHYSKVLILDKAFQGWQRGRVGREEVQRDLNAVDNEWLNEEDGQRPDSRLERRTCLTPGWKMMLEHLGKEGEAWLGGKEGTVMWEVRRLLGPLRRARQ